VDGVAAESGGVYGPTVSVGRLRYKENEAFSAEHTVLYVLRGLVTLRQPPVLGSRGDLCKFKANILRTFCCLRARSATGRWHPRVRVKSKIWKTRTRIFLIRIAIAAGPER
jgi:hypothetical protein